MKIKVYLYWVTDSHAKEGGRYVIYNNEHLDGQSNGIGGVYKLIAEPQEIEFDVTQFDARELVLDALKSQKAEIIAKATQQAEQIEEKIQQLLALPASAAA